MTGTVALQSGRGAGPLGELAARIATDPTRLRERSLPVDEVYAAMLPDAGLVRGRVVGCAGPAAFSLAFSLVAAAAQAGSWVAIVGMPAAGLEAVAELGVPLERVVLVDVDGGPSTWAERVATAADGFELVVTCPPAGGERVARRVRQRLQSNGVVLVAVDPVVPGVACDLDLVTSHVTWHGVGEGWGHLAARRVRVRVGGRRAPRPVERELLLPGPDGRVQLLDPVDHGEHGAVIELHRAG
jgi:hypothetical protein